VTFFPQPATLIGTSDREGHINLMMASWVGIVSKTPPTIAVALHQDRQTYLNILSQKVFSVNVVPSDMAVAADACGLVSGRTADKHQLSGLEIKPGEETQAPLVVDSPLNVECRFSSQVELGDYRLVLGEIVEIYAIEKAFGGNNKPDIKVFDPLVYLGGLREYWSLGEKKADAYRAGAAILKADNETD
jgi:flavin reductase (DIM6/NTAB) family NADH-FMN oxidoreductase RutF